MKKYTAGEAKKLDVRKKVPKKLYTKTQGPAKKYFSSSPNKKGANTHVRIFPSQQCPAINLFIFLEKLVPIFPFCIVTLYDEKRDKDLNGKTPKEN